MTNDELAFILKICSGLLLLALSIIGFFLGSLMADFKGVKANVQTILVTIGVLKNDVLSVKEENDYIKIKLADNQKEWTELYKNYDLQLKK